MPRRVRGHLHRRTRVAVLMTSFSFSANTEAGAVPDGGMTLALLGAGLMGLAAFRAKFRKV